MTLFRSTSALVRPFKADTMLKIIIKTAKWSAAGILIILLLSCALFGLAQTEYGKDKIVRLVKASLKEKSDIDLRVSKLSGLIPFHIEIDQIAFLDNTGTWAEFRNLDMQLSTLELLKGRLFIKDFTVDSIMLERLPRRDKKKISETAGPPSWLTMIYRLTLQRMNIARLSLGTSLLGKPADFSVEARVRGKATSDKSNILIKIERTDGPIGLALLDLKLTGHLPYLTVETRIEESGYGLAGRLLGTKGPVSLTLKGEGPVREWSGRLSARAEELAALEADVWLEASDYIRLNLAGTIEFYPGRVPEAIELCLDSRTNFAIKAHLIETRRLIFDLLTIDSANAGIKLNGMLDLKDLASEGRFTIKITDLSPLGRLLQRHLSGNLLMEGSFNGPLSQPRAEFSLVVKGLETDWLQAGKFTGNLQVALQGVNESLSPLPVFSLSGKGDITDTRGTAVSLPFSGNNIKWRLDMEGPFKEIIRFNKLEISSGDLSVIISGIVDYLAKRGTLELSLNAGSLGLLSDFSGFDLPAGSAVLNAKVDVDTTRRSLDADVSGKLDISGNGDPFILSLTGTDIEYSGNIELSNTSHIRFSEVNFRSDKAGLTCSGSYDFSEHEIDASLHLEPRKLSVLSLLVHGQMEGSAFVDASIEGNLVDVMNLNAEVHGENLSIEGMNLGNISAYIDVSGKPLKNKGHVSFGIEQSDYHLKGSSNFKLDDQVLNLNNILLETAGAVLKGDIFADIGNRLAEGELRVTCEDLTTLERLIGEKIRGSAGIKARFRSFAGDNLIDLNLHGKDIISRFGYSNTFIFNAELSGPLRDPVISADILLSDFQRDNLVFELMRFTAKGGLKDINFTSTVAGRAGEDMRMETSGSLSFTPGEQAIAIDQLQGEFGGVPVNLLSPCNISRSTGKIDIQRTDLSFATGYLEGSGNLSENYLRITLDFQEVPLIAIPFVAIRDVDGVASGGLLVSGDPGSPEASAEFVIHGLRIHNSHQYNLPPLTLESRSELKSGRLSSYLSIDPMTGNPFKAELNIPITLSMVPFSCTFPKNDELKGSLSGEIDLASVAAITGLVNQRLTGKIDIDFTLDGTLDSPRIAGRALLKEGAYENIRTGTVLKDIEADISSEPPRIFINRITAADGLGGTVSAKGWFDIIPRKEFPYESEFDLKNITLLHNDSLKLAVTGRSCLSGSMLEHVLTGDLHVEEAEFRIPDRLSPEITELDIIEINTSEPLQDQPRKRSVKKTLIRLDMSIESPGRIFVNGRGLNSEWNGNLLIKGTTSAPLITGKLSVLRGNYNFLGKRFNLGKGIINFDGRYPPAPYLDITGEAVTSDITAIVNLTGTIQNPEVELSSEPSLPSDEILSQLLFGRNVTQITPLQAIQLGNAINSILGRGGYGFMERTRRVLGVDQLEVKQSGDRLEESTITAGKYLSDEVYFEMEKGIGAESGKAAVKWEITPHLTVDTEVGENAETGAGINWKWDY